MINQVPHRLLIMKEVNCLAKTPITNQAVRAETSTAKVISP